MDGKRLVTGAVVGGILMWGLGWLVFVFLFGSMYDGATNLPPEYFKDPTVLWAEIAGSASLALLVTCALTWAGATSVASGFRVGATVGFLAWLGVDLVYFSFLDNMNLAMTLLDPVLEIFRTGAVGALLAMILNRVSAGEAA